MAAKKKEKELKKIRVEKNSWRRIVTVKEKYCK